MRVQHYLNLVCDFATTMVMIHLYLKGKLFNLLDKYTYIPSKWWVAVVDNHGVITTSNNRAQENKDVVMGQISNSPSEWAYYKFLKKQMQEILQVILG